MKKYDLIVIGSGPAGEKATIHAAYHGYKVAVVEKSRSLGGAGVNTGTLPSKTLKETALYLSGALEKGLYGLDREFSRKPNALDFLFRERFVVKTESAEVRLELLSRHVDVYFGLGSFADSHCIAVGPEMLCGEYILIATGSYPTHPAGILFDGRRIHDSETILQIDHIPSSLCIVGAGVIGCEYATIFATLGTRVVLVNSHKEVLPFLDREVSQALLDHARQIGIRIETDAHVNSVTLADGRTSYTTPMVITKTASGIAIETDMFLYAAGRNGNTRDLACQNAGLRPTARETLEVDEMFRTAVPHIFAVGDVIGFPALGSTSMDQGRVAVTHMFGLHDVERVAKLFPFGIYTIPEVSMIGLTEEEAAKQGINFMVGRARYQNVPRGLIIGAQEGFLKLVLDGESERVLGVHIFGHQATELIHYGMELVDGQKTLRHILGTVFNFPTLHELYKHAAYHVWSQALSKENQHERTSPGQLQIS
jgi:NAD(P) transhydrogenase